MAADNILNTLPAEVKSLRDDHEILKQQVQALDKEIHQFDTELAEIRESLRFAATKEDVANISAQIDRAINGLLRDALNAMPARQTMWWTAILAIATVGITVSAFLHVFPG